MGNASKAIIMAGAILITVLLISITMSVVTTLRDYSNVSSTQTQNSQVEAFNRFFVYSKPYGDGLIKGSDAYNIYKKAQDIKDRMPEYEIEIIFPEAIEYSGDYRYEYKLSDETGRVDKITIY